MVPTVPVSLGHTTLSAGRVSFSFRSVSSLHAQGSLAVCQGMCPHSMDLRCGKCWKSKPLPGWLHLGVPSLQDLTPDYLRRTSCRNKSNEVKSLSCVSLFATPWTVAHQGTLSMGFSWQEYWRGLPFPPPGDLHDPQIDKYNMLESPQTHPQTPVHGKTVFHETGVWCSKHWKPLPSMTSLCLKTGVSTLGYECISGWKLAVTPSSHEWGSFVWEQMFLLVWSWVQRWAALNVCPILWSSILTHKCQYSCCYSVAKSC